MDAVVEKAEEMFAMLDDSGDGEVSQEEFIAGCMQDEDLVKMLSENKNDWWLLTSIRGNSLWNATSKKMKIDYKNTIQIVFMEKLKHYWY